MHSGQSFARGHQGRSSKKRRRFDRRCFFCPPVLPDCYACLFCGGVPRRRVKKKKDQNFHRTAYFFGDNRGAIWYAEKDEKEKSGGKSMVFLILAVISSAAMNLGFELAGRKGCRRSNVCFANYLAAALMALGSLALDPVTLRRFTAADLAGAFRGQVTPAGSFGVSVVFGVVTGAVYFLALRVTQITVSKSGPGAATMFQRLGVVIPILASAVLFHEIPGLWQGVGILLALAALVLVSDGVAVAVPWLMLNFFTSGVSDFCNKFYQEFSLKPEKPLFLSVVFSVCLLLAAIKVYREHGFRFKREEFLLGFTIGLCNMAQAGFVLAALRSLPATVFYPLLSGGAILFTSAVSAVFFKERITRKAAFGMAVLLVSIFLINGAL